MKRYLWMLVACLALAWGGPASAAPEKPGEEIAFQLRTAPAGPIADADGRARFGIPALDRILERHGAREAEPVFRVGRGTNHELRSRLGMDRYFRVRLPRGADVAATARELRGVSEVAWVDRGERMTLHAEIGRSTASKGGRPFVEGGATGGAPFGQVPQFTPTSSLATATSHEPESIPNDPDFPKQWHLRNTGANPGVSTTLSADADMDVASAWTIEAGDPSIVVAIVDTGFKLDAPDLDGRLWSNLGEIPGNGIDDDGNSYTDDLVGYDFYYDDASPNVFPDPVDGLYDAHGTWVASLIGGEVNNATRTAGVDQACKLMLLQVGDPTLAFGHLGSSSVIASGITYAADNGAHVINLSFGAIDSLGTGESPEIAAAVAYAIAQGSLVVASMGNEGNLPNPSFPIYPAALPGVFAVGATTGTDTRAAFSSIGSHIDAVAPGYEIYGTFVHDITGADYTTSASGTSASAALASGVAALLFAQNPTRTASEVADLMRQTADDLVGGSTDTIGFDQYHGHGRLNAYHALVAGAGGQAPAITAPATVTGYEEQRIRVDVSVSDPDGPAIETLEWKAPADSPLLGNASFTTSADKSQGTLEWWPADGQAGSHDVWFVAESSIRATASTTITVVDKGRPPQWVSVQVPTGTTVNEGQPIQIDLVATDPDGDPIVEWAVNPGLPALPGGTLTPSPDLSSATFLWQTDLDDAGSYYTEIWAYSDSNLDPLVRLGALAYGTLVVNDVADQPPVVSAPATHSGVEGTPISFSVTVTDANGEAITSLTASELPTGATFTPAAGNASGDFTWTPASGQAGSYTVTFDAVSGINSLTGSATTTIEVVAPNLPPVVDAPAAISSPAGITISFPVTATDPEGEFIEQLVMSGLVKGMGFSTSGLGTPTATGTFTWTPLTTTIASPTFTASTDCATLPCQGSATTAITVTTGGPTLSLQAAYSVSEAAGLATITVTRTISSSGTLTVDYATADSTAVAGTDYTAVSGTLTFADGSLLSQSFTVPIIDNLVKEGNRVFKVTLANPTGGAVINRSTAPVGIQDNDFTRGTIGFAAADFPVNENAGSVTVTVARTGGSDGATTITYATDEGFYSEAFDGYHYTGVVGTLTWDDGDASSKTFTVPILDNADAEGNLRFRVTLGGFGLGEASPGLTSASVTILDDEAAPAPVLTVTPLSHDFGSVELGSNGTVAVTIQNTGSGTLTVALPTLTSGAAEGFSLSGAAPVGLAAGASASFTANFQPAALGAAAGSVSITSDGGSATVALSGTGVDTTPPSVAVTNPAGGESYAAGGSVLIEWTASDNHLLQSFDLEYSTDGGATFPNAIATLGGADRSYSWTVPSLAADASAAIRVTAHDASSNAQAATSNLFTILRLDTPATIDAIADVSLAEGSTVTVPVHASDAEGDPISLTATLPGFGALNAPSSGAGDLSTSITLAPDFSDAGSYSAAVSEAGGASVTFGITVSNTDQGLVLTAPASLSASERSLLTVDVTASDPDGEPVTSLTADLSGLPAGNDASFSIVGAALPAVLAEGRLTWTPDCQMAGSYSVSFSAVSVNSATATTTIDVANVGTAPAITAIADQTVAEGAVQGVPVAASDADGDPIMLAATLPAFGSFVDNGGGNGNITLSPGYEDAGSYSAEVTATESCDGSTTAAFAITVTNTDRPVTLAAAANESASEGIPFSMTVLAHDDDGDAIALTADLSGLPAGNDAEFSDAAINALEREGTLSWTPTYDDAGSHVVSFTATAGPASASATTTIAVANVNRAPAVTAPATQAVNENALLVFSISASDPDGTGALTLAADLSDLPGGPTFTDNGDNTGSFDWTPTYADAAGSPYFAIFTAADPEMTTGSATTQITVLDVASATAFPTSKSVLRLGAGKPNYFVAIEPVGGSFLLTDVDWTTVRMNSAGTGTVSSIAIDASKPVVVGDQDGNAVDDATVNFTKPDLRDLFALVSGRQMVPVTITGALTGGTSFTASMTIEVIGTGGALAASVSPNPLNPEAVLTFHVAKAGRVTVGLYDARGRLVRRVVSGEEMSRGWHDLRLDGRSDDGRTLTSGVYFYRIDTQENSISGRLTILK